MTRVEILTEALGKIDIDEISEALVAISKIIDKAIIVATFVAAATPSQSDDKIVATLALFEQAFSPLLDKTATFLASLDDAKDKE